MCNDKQNKGLLFKFGQKTVFSALLILLSATSLFAGKEYILKITLDDGSVKEYAVRYVTKLTFKADVNDEIDIDPKEYDIEDEDLDDFPHTKVLKKEALNADFAQASPVENAIKIIPTKQSILVSSLKTTPAKIFIFNMQGMCLKKFGAYLHSGLNQFDLDKATFKNNHYILRVKTPTEEISTQFATAD